MKHVQAETAGAVATASLRVNHLEAADRRRWDEFVAQCPDATFFHQSAWLDLVERVFAHRPIPLYAERAGEIVGVLPLVQVKSRLFGHAVTSLPFSVYGGCASTDKEAIAALHRAAESEARALGASHLELRDRVQREADWPQQDLYVTFRKQMEPDVESNMNAIPRKQRAMVRKGIKNGLASAIDPTVDRFFELYADNVHRHGTPALPKRWFVELKRTFGDRCEVLIVTDSAGTPVSGVISFYFRDEVLPYYAGDAVAARDLAANDFKYWELMRRACERGLKVFDYGRSKRGTGSFDFKKNWGFDPAPLHYEFRLFEGDSIPQNNPLNPKYRLMIETWRRLPRPVADFLGARLSRHLG
jgi:FemAB-related protein (PEP-CTERM system-associated)